MEILMVFVKIMLIIVFALVIVKSVSKIVEKFKK